MAQLDPPVPILAADIVFQAQVTFNHPLIQGALDHDNWSVRFGDERFAISNASVGAFPPTDIILSYDMPGVPDVGPDVVDFTPPPSDVISDTARQIPAPGFLNFPMT